MCLNETLLNQSFNQSQNILSRNFWRKKNAPHFHLNSLSCSKKVKSGAARAYYSTFQTAPCHSCSNPVFTPTDFIWPLLPLPHILARSDLVSPSRRRRYHSARARYPRGFIFSGLARGTETPAAELAL